MQTRLDPLIFDRAPWLARDTVLVRHVRPMLDRLLSYPKTVAIAEAVKDQPADRIMETVGRLIARQITVTGLSHIPTSGAALVVANHPTGIADGLVLNRVVSRRRRDAYFFANADILRVLPQMSDVITPVEWRKDRRSAAKTRTTLQQTRAAMEAQRLGVIFPSGRLAKRTGLRLVERPWMTSAASIARKFEVPIIPVHIRARNSMLFYGLDALHPTLRDITLFHEVLNKARQPFAVTVGAPIAPGVLPTCPDAATAALRQICLTLGEDGQKGLSMVKASPPALGLSGSLKWT